MATKLRGGGMLPKSTKKSEDGAEKSFQDFLKEMGIVENVHSLLDDELDGFLTEFWCSARKSTGELYRVNTLESWMRCRKNCKRNPSP